MNVETVKISELHEDPANVRIHPERNLTAIKSSLTRFGQQKPIVVGKDNVVIAGNGTLRAAQDLGWSTIEIVRTELEGPAAVAFAIADNRTSELAEWDEKGLVALLKELNDESTPISSIGFSLDEMEAYQERVDVKIKQKTFAPQKTAWFLIGVPVDKAAPVQEAVSRLRDIESVIIESCAN